MVEVRPYAMSIRPQEISVIPTFRTALRKPVQMTALMAAVFLCLPAHAQVPYSSGFEQPTFTVGPLPQDGWTAVAGAPAIQNSVVFEGSQSLEVPSGGATEKTFTTSAGQTLWLDGRTRVTPEDGAPDPTLLRDGSTFLFFDSTLGILGLDGDGSGSGTWLQTGVNPAAGTWVRITIKMDFTAKDWDIYIDENLELSGLGFRNNTIDRLNGFSIDHQNSTSSSYLDAFSVDTSAPAFLATPTPTSTPAPTNTPTPIPTNTPTPTPTHTLVPTATPTPPPNTFNVWLEPDTIERTHPASGAIIPDFTAAVDLYVGNAVDFQSFDVRLSYDPAIIRLTGVDDLMVGSFPGSTGNSVNITEQTWNNTTGQADMAAEEVGANPGPDGSGVLAKLVWHTQNVNQKRTSPVTIESIALASDAGAAGVSTLTDTINFTVCYWADVDCSDDVSIIDIQRIAGRWNSSAGDANYDPLLDVTRDGNIDIVDIQLVAGKWNESAPF